MEEPDAEVDPVESVEALNELIQFSEVAGAKGPLRDELETLRKDSRLQMINSSALDPTHIGFEWGLIKHLDKNYGYISHPSFSSERFRWLDEEGNPAQATVDDLLGQMLEILDTMTREHHVNGLVIDVRDNGGGRIDFSENLVQFFAPNFVTAPKFRLLNSQLNRTLMVESGLFPGEAFAETLKETPLGNTYTKPIPFFGEQGKFRSNFYGQAFHKPVVVLTNSACYSACDMFSAIMQDNGAAQVWSEGRRTGAGGANVVPLSFFLAVKEFGGLTDLPVQPLPHGQSITVPWRQIIRSGKSDGKRIETDGVIADRTLLKTWSDLMNGIELPIDELIEYFEVESMMQDLEWTAEFPAPFFEVKKEAADVEVPINIKGVGHILVQLEGLELSGSPIFQMKIDLDGKPIDKLRLPLPAIEHELYRFRIIGKTGNQTHFNKMIFGSKEGDVKLEAID